MEFEKKDVRFYILAFVFLILLLFSSTLILANEKYSYEKAEELTPLIEWREYGNDAFLEAKNEKKPVFLLLTAPSWCYWCQVYESEDYLFHPDVVSTINEKFIPIYVDADKRQDLTRQYLEGGWPSTTVMMPDKTRLYGFSGVRPVPNMITNLNNAYTHVQNTDSSFTISYNYEKSDLRRFSVSDLIRFTSFYEETVLNAHDSTHGGFGTNQKFPQPRSLIVALDVYERTSDTRYLDVVTSTLEGQYTEISELQTNYNLFDPVEGGFHRYGVQRDWTPPHYEKMLYDNAKLLRAYATLSEIDPENVIAQEVTQKTDSFIQREWYDETNGGFYGNSDVHGEDLYYGNYPRVGELPRVEKTKYTNWNSEAIITYLELYERANDPRYETISRDTLDFYYENMFDKNGAYHYMDENGNKGVQGNVLDNAYLLAAFVHGYETFGDERYLDGAEKIASYSFETLYDWNSAGFFERNSDDTESYALGDNIILSKPSEENSIMAYSLLKLYTLTSDELYLVTGIRTLQAHIERMSTLDSGYYYVKSFSVILDNGLLRTFNEDVAQQIEEERQKDFWLNDLDLSAKEFEFSTEGIDSLNSPLVVLLFVALLAGFISFVSPCTLPILPAFLAYSLNSSKKNIVGMSVSFFLGLSLVFTVLGMSATAVGNLLKDQVSFFSEISGIVIIGFGLYMLLGKGFSGIHVSRMRPLSYISSFVFGATLGISWTPCVGPILVVILLLASSSGSVVSGGLLLFLYAVGLSLPLLFVSIYFKRIDKESRVWKFMKGKQLNFMFSEGKTFSIHSSSLISGVIFIILGYLIYSGGLVTLNSLVGTSSLQEYIYAIEDFFLSRI